MMPERRPRLFSSFAILPAALLFLTSHAQDQVAQGNRAPTVSVVPAPVAVTPGVGEFSLTDGTIVAATPASDAVIRIADGAAHKLAELSGVAVAFGSGSAESGMIRLRLDSGTERGREAYTLTVTPDSVVIDASAPAGLFYGVQTLAQLVGDGSQGGAVAIASVIITDAPRFSYRGMHLDVGRHLFPVEFLKRYIDLLAAFKMNTFHWHLTEDQGWRIEIERYPRLTEVGAWRRETIFEKNFDPYVGDGEPYGGFYTQDEIRELVAYAAERYVTIIPEIELPGHSLAALAAYPELACTAGPFEVGTRWGVYEDIYCPKEETFAFLENVLAEVVDLFPGPYVHIGGDEAPKARWEASRDAQDVMRREELADEHELQSYFIQRIERFLSRQGRRLIGWDEILEGGLPPEATVMSWRGMSGGIEAARHGHDVIMTPTSHAYFDYYQGDPDYEPLAIGGFTPLEKVYEFEPVPPELTLEQARHVLGAQGNVWTEYMKTTDYVEYMVFPRLLALAEVVWSPRERRDWEDFSARLPRVFDFLDHLDVNYRVPDVRGLEHDRLTLDASLRVALQALIDEAVIHYTLDGSIPDRSAPQYHGPLDLDLDSIGTVVTARAALPDGRQSAPRSARFRRATLRVPVTDSTARLLSGTTYRYYEESVRSVSGLEAATPVTRGVSNAFSLPGFERPENFGLVFDALVYAPEDGIYEFALRSDDGSRLWIGNTLVVDHDGPHAMSERSGLAALAQGYHPVRVAYFQARGGRSLNVRVRLRADSTTLAPPVLKRRER